MNTEQKHLITCTLAVYQESTDKRKTDLREQLKQNIKNFPEHKNVQASNVFLRIIQNQ